jgi:hypothetical protein
MDDPTTGHTTRALLRPTPAGPVNVSADLAVLFETLYHRKEYPSKLASSLSTCIGISLPSSPISLVEASAASSAGSAKDSDVEERAQELGRYLDELHHYAKLEDMAPTWDF